MSTNFNPNQHNNPAQRQPTTPPPQGMPSGNQSWPYNPQLASGQQQYFQQQPFPGYYQWNPQHFPYQGMYPYGFIPQNQIPGGMSSGMGQQSQMNQNQDYFSGQHYAPGGQNSAVMPSNMAQLKPEKDQSPQQVSKSKVNQKYEKKVTKKQTQALADEDKSQGQHRQRSRSNPVNSQSTKKIDFHKELKDQDRPYTNEEERKTINKIIKKFRFNWKKLALHSFHLLYDQIDQDDLFNYYSSLEHNETSKNLPFTREEDQLIIELMNKYGRDWDKIEKNFSNRSLTMIRNRYYYLTKKGNLINEGDKWVLLEGDDSDYGEDSIQINPREIEVQGDYENEEASVSQEKQSEKNSDDSQEGKGNIFVKN